MRIIILASGSKGNSTYIETDNTKILIDAGISYKKMAERLKENNIFLDQLDAILVTHEHIDHVMHLASISNKCNTKIFITQESFENLNGNILNQLKLSNTFFISVEKRYSVNEITFVPIQLFHDTKNTVGYLFKIENNNIAYITDTGHILPKYYSLLRQMNYLIIESNHDVEMLLNSNRDYRLKRRILSKNGHLSNDECSLVLKEVISSNTKCIVLAHLSEECNTQEIAYNSTFKTIEESSYKPLLLIAEQNTSLEVISEKKSA